MEILEPIKEHFFKNHSYWWCTCSYTLKQENIRRPRLGYINPLITLITVIIIPVELALLCKAIHLQIAYAAWCQDLRTGSHHNHKRTNQKRKEYITCLIHNESYFAFFFFKMGIVYVLSLNEIRNIATSLFSNDRWNIWL